MDWLFSRRDITFIFVTLMFRTKYSFITSRNLEMQCVYLSTTLSIVKAFDMGAVNYDVSSLCAVKGKKSFF